MSAPENFLRRWSRRKRAAAAPERTDEATRDAAAAPAPPDDDAPSPSAAPAPPVVDLARLPPIESITATTDVSLYLAPGVPPELTRAALRRAWLADPAIRDFVGLAENQWDFTAPHGAPGFGALAEDEARRLVGELLGEAEAKPAPATSTIAAPDQAPKAQVSAALPPATPAADGGVAEPGTTSDTEAPGRKA
jgi:hypothetical protein